jgi:hypothetical protein
MENLESAIFSLLEKLEAELQETVVMEGDTIEYFDDPAMECLADKEDEIAALIETQIPALIQEKAGFDILPPIARCSDIYGFNSELVKLKDKFPLIQDFTENLEPGEIVWQPLYVALRSYFDLERIREISSEYEFKISCSAYLILSELVSEYLTYGNYDSCKPQVDELKESSFANPEVIKELDDLSFLLTPAAQMPHTPRPIVFESSTGGLEPRFVEWFEKHVRGTSLFDEEDFDLLAPDLPEDQDWLNLLSCWFENDPNPPTSFENYKWTTIDANAPIDFEYEGLPIFFEVHQLSQIVRESDRQGLKHLPQSMEYYKITMFRTGEPHEYNDEMDRSLLALQVLLFHQSSEIPVEKIEAEVHWVRLKEFAYPLIGLNAGELEQLSQVYLEAQKS